ncbi:MAG: ABC transporter ATP-binding protein [Spirochaetales bacterium]|nr:ABC transporter ATP-binding protein [Spirochaetales bacterium]
MINVENVKRTYIAGDLKVEALRGVDLLIKKGEFISIAGPSGSGKTTLLNIIGCIDKLDGGKVSIEGQNVGDLSKLEKAAFRRNELGFIFQSYNLIPVLSAFENVSFALSLINKNKKEVKEKTLALLREVGLEGMEDRRPSRLSGGQQQRVAIARALIKNPKIILADEPTANLDSHTGEDILKLMKEMNEKHQTTFIFSTHDRMVMDYARRLVLLHDGLVTEDTVKEGA